MSLVERLTSVRHAVAAAARKAGRDPEDVKLLAVSKTFHASAIEEGFEAGQLAFGENRVQEAETKLPALSKRVRERAQFHFVGQLQRNKARRAAELFDVVHSVDRESLARALDRAAGELGKKLEVFLQVDVDGEAQKGGAAADTVHGLLETTAALPHLVPIGLMAIPAARAEPEQMRPAFRRLRALRDELGLRELSMGMTADFEIAIEEGATWVRVGTAIFGPRKERGA